MTSENRMIGKDRARPESSSVRLLTVDARFLQDGRGRISKTSQVRNWILAITCAAILAGILVAGLWPFHAARNQVYEVANGGGMWFGRHGTVLSTGAFKAQDVGDDDPCDIDIGLTPATTWDRNTILSFYAGNRGTPLSLHQSNRDLLIESQRRGARPESSLTKLYVLRVFRGHRKVFIAITSDGHETSVYVNGVLAAVSRTFAFSSKDLAGRLIVANSPLRDDSWSGLIRELAIYKGFLSQRAALRRYRTWAESGRPAATQSARPLAVYLFDQPVGPVIRNQTGEGPDLSIPKRFTVLDHIFLEQPRSEYKYGQDSLKNIVINIAGFVPLGFIFCAYFSLVRRSRHAIGMSIIVGAAVSVTIEVLQAFLPTRFSGMTDIFTNTVGTAVGACTFAYLGMVCESLSPSRSQAVRQVAGWLIERA